MKKRIWRLNLVMIFFLLGVVSCVSVRPPRTEKAVKGGKEIITVGYADMPSTLSLEYPDVAAKELAFEAPRYELLASTQTNEYINSFNSAVDCMNFRNFESAAEILEPMAGQYDDGGRMFFNLAVCYYNVNDFGMALRYAAYASAAGYANTAEIINVSIFQLAYGHLDKNNFVESIAYFKNCSPKEEVGKNVLYAYLEHAKTLSYPQNAVMLLYAGDYAIRNRLVDQNLVGIGNTLGSLIFVHSTGKYVDEGIDLLRYVLTITDDPHIHKYLAFLHLKRGDKELAKKEFERIVGNSKNDQEMITFAREKIVEHEKVQYRYTREMPFVITGLSGDVSKAGSELILSMPQTHSNQTVSNLTLLCNGKPLAFEVVIDEQGAEFIKTDPTSLLRPGKNTVVMQAVIERESRRFPIEGLKDLAITSYDTSSHAYKTNTGGDKIFVLTHPLVKKLVAELRKKTKGANLIDTVRAVYDIVIDKMTYEMYDLDTVKRTNIVSRLEKNNFRGVCGDYAVLTVCLLRSFGIPAVVLDGPYLDAEIGHAWPAFFPPDFSEPIVIDATWGDNLEMADYYFMFNSNLTAIERRSWDSNVLPEGQSSYIESTVQMSIDFQKETTRLTRIK